MADEKKPTQPSMPAQPPTRQLPAMTQEAMIADIYKLAKSTSEEVKTINMNVDVLTQHVDTLTSRVTLVERRQDDVDTRATKHSGGLVRESTTNAQQSAEIAAVIIEQKAQGATLATHTTKLDRLETSQEQQSAWLKSLYDKGLTFWSDPKVVILRNIVYGAIVLWAAQRGLVAK